LNDRPSETSEFALSRIQAQGWNAAKKLLVAGENDIDADAAASRNPYRTEVERSRWTAGFMKALESSAGPYTTPGGNSWRPAPLKRSVAE
jgi:hypothetical protein